MELRQLQTFRVVARSLSFTRAAETLDYAQSSVTAQVRRWRTTSACPCSSAGRRVALTDAGVRLLGYADDSAAGRGSASRRPGGASRGDVGHRRAGVAMRLPLATGGAAISPALPPSAVHLSAGALRRYPPRPGRWSLDLGSCSRSRCSAPAPGVEPLIRERLVAWQPPDTPARAIGRGAGRRAGGAAAVDRDRLQLRELFERSLAARRGIAVDDAGVQQRRGDQAVRDGRHGHHRPAGDGRGRQGRQGRLVALPWAGSQYSVVTQVAWHKDKWLSPALQAFLDLTRSTLQETMQEGVADGVQPSTCPSALIAASPKPAARSGARYLAPDRARSRRSGWPRPRDDLDRADGGRQDARLAAFKRRAPSLRTSSVHRRADVGKRQAAARVGRFVVGLGQRPALQREVRPRAADDVAITVAGTGEAGIGAWVVVGAQLVERGVDVAHPRSPRRGGRRRGRSA